MRMRIILCISLFVSFFYGGELLENGSFEIWSGGLPVGWDDETGASIVQEADTVYDGSYSVGIDITGTTNAGIYQQIPVSEGVSYTYKVWVYSTSGTGSGGLGILISWYDTLGNYIGYKLAYNTQTYVWEEITLVDTAPSGAGYAMVKIRGYANNAFAGYVDFASFYPTDSPPTIAPTISEVVRNPVSPKASEDITVRATVTDDGEIITSRLYYNVNLGTWTDVIPDSVVDSFYYFTIPGQNDGDLVRYYVYVMDNDSNSTYSDTFSVQIGDATYYVYFQDDTLPAKLGAFIAGAQYSLDICMYEVFRQEVVDSILSAWNRGVKVRVITDSSYYDEPGTQQLVGAGIPVIHEGIGDNSAEHIMHHKFVVRDYRDSDPTNDWLWVGSYNASDYLHCDNAIAIKSSELADAFEREFNQMWGDTGDIPNEQLARTGTNKVDVLPTHSFVVGGDSVWVYFSPQDSAIQYLVQLVNRAQSEIGYLIYSYTRDDLAQAMINAFNSGVWVGGVHEDNTLLNPAYQTLYDAGVPVYWCDLPPEWYLLHDKFMVIDRTFVETGSMNWSTSGNSENDENVIIIKDPVIAQLYWEEFAVRYTEAGGTLSCEPKKRVFTGHLRVFPNPFVSKCYFNIEKAEIYDVTGRLIKKVNNSGFWDGKDMNGRTVSPGVYFIKDPERKEIIRVVKIR